MIQDRIKQLRALMAERKIDVYYIPNEDDHLSDEYTADYFKCKSYMSGFSGEAGCTIITKDFAGLWTDGRFFTQAENELQGTGVTLMRLRQEGVPNPIDFLIANTPKNGVLGFDGAVVSARNYLHLTQALKEKNAKLQKILLEWFGGKKDLLCQQRNYMYFLRSIQVKKLLKELHVQEKR